MSREELNFFGGHINELDNLNRRYLWKILYDHVKLGMMKIEDFWKVLIDNLRDEQTEEIVLILLGRVHWLVTNGFIEPEMMRVDA